MNTILKKMTAVTLLSLTALVLVFAPLSTEAKTVKVKSYYKPSTGKYIHSYHKTSPNKTKIDNFSTKGNTNPYTGKKGSKKP